MADDKRTYDLTAITASELSTLLSTLELDVDDPSYSAGESKRLALSLLLNSDIVEEGSTIEHFALTPKGFAASVATIARKGIVEKSTDEEFTTGTADKYPDSLQIKNADDDVKANIGIRFRVFGTVSSTGSATKYGGDLSFTASRLNTGEYQVTHNLGSTQYFIIANTMRSDSVRSQTKIAAIHREDNYFKVDCSDDSSANDTWFEFALITYL